jgi:hypothetical protein
MNAATTHYSNSTRRNDATGNESGIARGSVRTDRILSDFRNCLMVSIAAFALFFTLAPISFAQDIDDPAPTQAELEQFRADLSLAIRRLNASIEKMKESPAMRNAVAKAGNYSPQKSSAGLRQLEKLSYDDLETLYSAFNTHFPKWRDSPATIERLAEKVSRTAPLKNGNVAAPNAITPDNCDEAFAADPSWTDWSITKTSEIAGQAAYEVIPEPFNGIALGIWSPIAVGAAIAEFYNVLYERCSGAQDVAAIQTSITTAKNVLYERIDNNADYVINNLTGVAHNLKNEIVNNDNVNKTAIVTAITDAQSSINNNVNSNTTAITNAVTTAKTEIITNDNINRTTIVNNDNSNATAINTNVNNTRSTIINNDNTNTTNIVNNDNTNRTLIINNSNSNTAALNDLILRGLIEADLATESNGVKVAWYMTPTANGGKLDLVQQIVTQTLASIVAAGGSIGNAQSFLNKANADKAAGDFKSAYDNYRKAYKAAAN